MNTFGLPTFSFSTRFFRAVMKLIKNLQPALQGIVQSISSQCCKHFSQFIFSIFNVGHKTWGEQGGTKQGEQGREVLGELFTLPCRWQENSLLFEGTKCDAEIVLHFNLIRFFFFFALYLPGKGAFCWFRIFSRGC